MVPMAHLPGDVIVVDGGGRETALAGELFARAALNRGLAGIVVDGGYRDLAYVARCALPVYSRHVTPMAGSTVRSATLNEPVSCGGVRVSAGDIVIADIDGIVVLDPALAAAQLRAAAQVKATEARVEARHRRQAADLPRASVDETAVVRFGGPISPDAPVMRTDGLRDMATSERSGGWGKR